MPDGAVAKIPVDALAADRHLEPVGDFHSPQRRHMSAARHH
jgi:hypothetical protein